MAREAGVSLSSTTWHFATKADILEAALRWTADYEVGRIAQIAERLGDTEFDPAAWADELADWLIEQVTTEREVAVALYRLQIELADSPGARRMHREWGRGLRAVAETRGAGARRPADRRRARRPAPQRAALGRGSGVAA